MNSPEEVSQFLRWYHKSGDEQKPTTDTQLPSWLEGRTPPLMDEGTLVALGDYDLKARLSEAPPEVDGEWLEPAEHRQDIEQTWQESTEQEGFEAFAWYVPFHYSPRRWGIYVSEEGIQVLGNLLYEWSHNLKSSRQQASTGGATELSPFDFRGTAFRLALEILLRHEWYHHQVELLASYIEDVTGELCYEKYHEGVYRQEFPTADCIEESLANVYVTRSRAAKRHSPSNEAFDLLFKKSAERQPEAYAEFEKFTGSEFYHGNRALGYLLKTGNRVSRIQAVQDSDIQLPLASNIPFTTAVHNPRTHRLVPIYIVRPWYNLQTLSYFKAVQLETNYDLERSDLWEKKYANSPDMQELVDKTENKLRKNANLPGFNWRSCPGRYDYGRMNNQYRMIVERDETNEIINLIDFGGHELPTEEYSCY